SHPTLPSHPYPLSLHDALPIFHRFQMFTDFDNVAIVTRLERQKRAAHILVEEAGPPVPTVPGFVVPGAENLGPFLDRGPRCPLRSEEHTSELQSRFDLVCRLLL